MINVDIHSTVLTATFLAAVAALLFLIFGTKGVIKSRKIPFFAKRHKGLMRGWRLLLLGLLLIPTAFGHL